MWNTYYSNSYRLGIKRKWFFGYKIYHVVEHHTATYIMREELKNLLNIRPRLNLYLVDGSQICVPEIESRQWKLYPEYKAIEDMRKANKAVDTFAAKKQRAPQKAPFAEPQREAELNEADIPKTLQ